ncbi:phage major capsid protein [Methylobacterium sp. J-078]|uniref:phage major capsid protein n=1 Tax=Methylobacterium sp. J-078 TaxID=2836657 RepID=UPI001FBAA1B1|nr:phage major capsid protein [Methylobacterium sp. J-078]MCJ2044733.1 phage major capsid protein [Methylobacterium sp. J-078]
MRTLIHLREQRGLKVDAIRAIHAKAATENRDLTDTEQSAFDTGKGEVERLEREIRNHEFLADAERRAEAEPVTERGGGMADLEARFSASKALAEFTDTGRLTGAEAEWAAEHRSGRPGAIAMPTSVFLGERRALLTTNPVAGPGGNLVPTNQGALIDRVRPTLVTESLGATVLQGLTGNLDLPRVKDSGQAFWVPEHGNVQRSDMKFDKVSMGPKTVGAEYEVSRRMLLQATALEPILRADISFLLRQALDAAAIKGGGANEPVGILATPGLTVLPLGTNGGVLSIDTAADMIAAIDDDADGSRGFLITKQIRTAALKQKDGQGQPYGLGTVFSGEQVRVSKAMPSNGTKGTGTNLSAAIYGIWSDLVIGYWSAVDIVPNPYHSDVASKGGLLLHAFLDADVASRHIENFVAVTDAKTA